MAIENRIFEFSNSIIREAEIRKKAIARLVASGDYTDKHIKDQQQKAIESLQKEVKAFFDSLKGELKEKLAKIEAKYTQNPVGDSMAQLLAFQRTKARLEAMNSNELSEKAQQYISTGVISSIDELDLLTAELRKRNMNDLADRIQQEAKQRYFTYQPWKADPEYQQIEKDLAKVNAYGADPNIVYVNNNGVVEIRRISEMLQVKPSDVI
ncbi:hypothetical protein L1766_07170 [Thermovorax subterraneus]|nr:hypothetical protein [Thermovorax subterraneus]